MDATLQKIVSRLEDITARLERVESGSGSGSSGSGSAGAGAAGVDSGSDSPALVAYDAFVAESVTPWASAAAALTPDAAAAAGIAQTAFERLRGVIAAAARCGEPAGQKGLQEVVAGIGAACGAAQDLKSKAKRTPHEHHCAAVAEGLGALSWVVIKPAPAPFVKEQNDASEFYANKVRVAHKGEAMHIAYVDGFKALLTALAAYVKQHHTTGLSWKAGAPAATAADIGSGSGSGGGGGMAALFGELNKGAAITSGLKKVTRDMTNKDKQVSGAVTEKAKPATATATPAATATARRQVPEKLELDGTKWKVEGFKGRKDLEIVVENPKQVLYCYGLVNCVVTVRGKCNHITLDGCTKTGVVFDDVVAAVELVRCKSAQVQSNGTVPSMAIENSDGVHIYWLDPRNNDCEVITSCSSEVNITLKYDGDEEFSEVAIPQQYLTQVKGKSLDTAPISHLG